LTISAVWAMGILVGTTHLLWLIDADLAKCNIVPVRYHLVDVLAVYTPVCICLITCYGRILAISRRQRRRMASASPATGAPSQTTTVDATATHIENYSGIDTADPSDKPTTAAGASSEPAVTSGAASASELTHHEQQRQKIKSRPRTRSSRVAAGKCFRAFRTERES